MNKLYVLLVVITSFIIQGPFQPGNEYQVQITTDTLTYPITDSCVAASCYQNALNNLGSYNDQSKQMITGVKLDTIEE
ncbi:MAG: hypothetical protein AB9842_08305 [Bacteroidales bacterium]